DSHLSFQTLHFLPKESRGCSFRPFIVLGYQPPPHRDILAVWRPKERQHARRDVHVTHPRYAGLTSKNELQDFSRTHSIPEERAQVPADWREIGLVGLERPRQDEHATVTVLARESKNCVKSASAVERPHS